MSKSTFKLKMNLTQFNKKLKPLLKKRLLKIVVRLEAYVKAHFGPSNQKGKNPSSPGGTPNVGTGTLRNSITHDVKIVGNEVVGMYGVRKGPASVYALALEKGYSPRNLAPRPFLTPAYRANKKNLIRWLRR